MRQRGIAIARAVLLVTAFAICRTATPAQTFQIRQPVNTTLVISRPAPDEIFGEGHFVTLSVGTRVYKFLLNDAYVDSTRVRWPDIWEQVRIHRPNFIVMGPHADEIEHIRPGEMKTLKGMFAPLDRTYEVVFTEAGRGPFEPKKHY